MGSELKWDGSDLGTITEGHFAARSEQIHDVISGKKIMTWEIETVAGKIEAIVFPIIDYQSIISDGLKLLFNLKPNGTHSVKVKSKHYLLIKLTDDLRSLYRCDLLVDTWSKMSKRYQDKIRQLLIFRSWIGMYPNTLATILIDPNEKIDPISLYENMVRLNSKGTKTFSKTVYQQIFDGDPDLMATIAQTMIPELSLLRTKIFEIIKNRDKTRIYNARMIHDRIIYSIPVNSG